MLLTLAELEASSRFLLTKLLPFNTSGIPAKQTGCFESRPEFRIEGNQRTGNAELCSFSLTFFSATCSIDLDVVLTSTFNCFDGKFHLILKINLGKICLVIQVVHGDVSVTLAEEDAGYRFFPTTQSVFFVFPLLIDCNRFELKFNCYRLLCTMRMLIANINK